jgi:hypothetical protein
MSWTQPLCERCWFDEHDHMPTRFTGGELAERCCLCGKPTVAGIFVRMDPAKVPYPTADVD